MRSYLANPLRRVLGVFLNSLSRMGRRAPETRGYSSELGGIMKKRLIALAMAVASLGLVMQGGSAKAFLLNDRSPNVTAGQIIVGAGMSAVYFTQTCNRNFSRCARFDSARSLKWFGLTTVGCLSLAPIVSAALVSHNENRELRSSEVFMIAADCVVPIIGGWIAKAAFNAHPEWDAGTGLSKRR
jgi:hypothetical protein